jgi:hypothetical protein
MATSKTNQAILDLGWAEDDEAENLPTVRVENAPLSVNSIPFEYPELPPASGRIEGAWRVQFWGDDREVGPQKFLLPAGETIRMPKGTAVAAHDRNEEWVTADFPLGGRLVGPLVYANIEPADPQELADEFTRDERLRRPSPFGRGTMGVFAASVAAMCGAGIVISYCNTAEIDAPRLLGGVFLAGVAGGAITLGRVLVYEMKEWLSDIGPKKRFEDITTPPSIDRDIDLPIRLRSLVGYTQVAIAARLAHYKADSFDTDITEALGSYRHRRRVLAERGEPLDSTLEHSAKMIAEIEQKIAGSPQLLCNQEVKARYLDLIRRAEGQVNKRIEARDEALSADVLSDIAMLVKQIER